MSLDIRSDAAAMKANGQGRDAFFAKKARDTCPYSSEAGQDRQETNWLIGYDRAKYDHDVQHKTEKPKQEFIFPATCFAPHRKVLI